MNRGSEAMTLDWLRTASVAELNAATAVMQSRRQELQQEASQSSTKEGGPVTYADFGFTGAARAFYRTEFPDAHEVDVAPPPDSIVDLPTDNFHSNSNTTKPVLLGFDVVNVGGMG